MGAATIGQGLIGMIGAGKTASNARARARDSKNERDRLAGELEVLEDGRQPIINPYANVTDTSGEQRYKVKKELVLVYNYKKLPTINWLLKELKNYKNKRWLNNNVCKTLTLWVKHLSLVQEKTDKSLK